MSFSGFDPALFASIIERAIERADRAKLRLLGAGDALANAGFEPPMDHCSDRFSTGAQPSPADDDLATLAFLEAVFALRGQATRTRSRRRLRKPAPMRTVTVNTRGTLRPH